MQSKGKKDHWSQKYYDRWINLREKLTKGREKLTNGREKLTKGREKFTKRRDKNS